MKNYAHCKENLFSRADLSGTTCNIEANILNLYIITFPEGSHQLLIFILRLYRGGYKGSGGIPRSSTETFRKHILFFVLNESWHSGRVTHAPYYFYNLETLHTFPLLEDVANAIPVLLTFI